LASRWTFANLTVGGFRDGPGGTAQTDTSNTTDTNTYTEQERMIKTLKVKNLNSRHNLDLSFNDDLNLLTGKNGSSKTTLLKLIWFLNSGQLANLVQEVNFEFAEIVTSNDTATIDRQLEKGLSRFQLNSDPV